MQIKLISTLRFFKRTQFETEAQGKQGKGRLKGALYGIKRLCNTSQFKYVYRLENLSRVVGQNSLKALLAFHCAKPTGQR